VQFSSDPEALNKFFRQMVSNTGPYDAKVNIDAVSTLFDKVGPGILVTHRRAVGQAGSPQSGRETCAPSSPSSQAETFLFPKGKRRHLLPSTAERLDHQPSLSRISYHSRKYRSSSTTATTSPEKLRVNPGQEQWCVFLEMARKWRDAVNKRGGNVTVMHLPEIGIRGNTHFPMSDLNNLEVTDVMSKFLKEKGLD
jgi:hypothetical protein